ncbi:MAG: hypothetical protein ABIJ09_05655 [Pseudomonadota bacterium]
MPGGIRGGTPLRPLPQQQPKTEQKGKSTSAGIGGTTTGGAAKAKKGRRKGEADGSTGVGVGRYTGVGLSELDEWEDDPEEQRHRRNIYQLLGDDDPLLMSESVEDGWEPLATIAPEFRPHVAARMAEARSMTSGSTISKAKSKKSKSKKAG